MKDRSDDPSYHERTLLPRSYISLPTITMTQQQVVAYNKKKKQTKKTNKNTRRKRRHFTCTILIVLWSAMSTCDDTERSIDAMSLHVTVQKEAGIWSDDSLVGSSKIEYLWSLNKIYFYLLFFLVFFQLSYIRFQGLSFISGWTLIIKAVVLTEQEGRKENIYLTTHSTHFIYGHMASGIW